ncbi:iron complex transport system ATP-binding protein [Clostridium acetobutylicum]|uniref:Iron (III) ABC transporter, ATPase component n=1 Tax=Clostridium acetobutylicum (strain ATCC 824 / DSM 792 / JCM 1419 / IAM 19013 / LMG 5710 / NBRC 13948 / NRRL B-527 / VKM B-1787 / 2291 / W) TaxID=272562 RepID=Q97GC5_CLOAB|nr:MULTISPECIES: ABC transporter ATP-binding protein [Clostridium]AAK80397.1 Iron (III) ABC transporter, ATPase component [Clostridium acetobutylicum ATCC 824]ADZ21494.1 Iron (III) ABC transporter, ATPase component [Clostridium acetobutylicum EA 2018]AEI34644.1 ABC-type iron (III) transport system, ATPase component [Clostridium acetobutylicum DSM 1731]AWV79185.1 ABC transporter ATP-binding protein [Clostridium acetobutylicum]MBC2394851.1 ABC transporter ATP-binding protein [Clostridium acetobu
MIVFKAENLSVGYNGVKAVSNINFSAKQGEIICLLGPNGAGKTTIIRTLSGLLPPIEGEIHINGKSLSTINKKLLAQTLSVVLTEKPSFDVMTAFDVVSLGRFPHTGFFGTITKEHEIKVVEALKTVGALNLIDKYFHILSDGERQKVMLARALVQEPQIIILDEPTTHLDINHKIELLNTLKNLSRTAKLTVILSLHEIDLALKYCDKVMLVENKKVLSFGSPETTVNGETINKLYGIKNASFNPITSSIELKNSEKSNIYVIGGCGFGTPIYRLLSKYNLGFSTGILHENDIDYETAKTMSLRLQSEKPFQKISKISFEKALAAVASSDIIIDSGFPIGETNEKNLNLLNYAVEKNKRVITFRKYFNSTMSYCSNKDALIDFILR